MKRLKPVEKFPSASSFLVFVEMPFVADKSVPEHLTLGAVRFAARGHGIGRGPHPSGTTHERYASVPFDP
jgi:hypothetical protein